MKIWQKTKFKILLLIVPISILLDQWTKFAIVDAFRYGERKSIVPEFFDLTYIRNKGAAFGLLNNAPDEFRIPFFLAMPLIALGFIGYLFAKLPDRSVLLSSALSLVIAGAIGNLFDRVHSGSVVDFLLVHWKSEWFYPAFNVADICICIGVGLMMVDLFMQKPEEETSKKKATA